MKLLLVGDFGVGKSSILLRFVDDVFSGDTAFLGMDYKTKPITLDGRPISLECHDTAGQEKYSTLTASFFRSAHGTIIIYDVTNRESFSRISSWVIECSRYVDDKIPMMIVGNKCDLQMERQVTMEEAQELAERYKFPFFEISAKTGKGLNEVFNTMARITLNHMEEEYWNPWQ